MKKIMLSVLAVSLLGMSTLCLASPGGYLDIVNNSDHALVLSNQQTKHMNKWDLPDRINAHSTARKYIEFGWNLFYSPIRDFAESNYSVEGCAQATNLHINATVSNNNKDKGPMIFANASNASCIRLTPDNGSVGWEHNGRVQLTVQNV